MMTAVRWLTPRDDDDCHAMRMTVAWWWQPHGNDGYTIMAAGRCLILRISWWLLFLRCPWHIVVLGSQVCQIHVKAFHYISGNSLSNYSMYRPWNKSIILVYNWVLRIIGTHIITSMLSGHESIFCKRCIIFFSVKSSSFILNMYIKKCKVERNWWNNKYDDCM